MKIALISFISIILCGACGQTTDSNQPLEEYSKVDPIAAARPDGITLPSQELSHEDKMKLSQAKGRTASHISIDSFIVKLNNSKSRLFIYHFWKMECEECLLMNKRLSRLSNEIANKNLYIELVNLDEFSQINELNTYIRKDNITLNTIQIDPEDENFSLIEQTLKLMWNEQIPALFLINHSNGTNLHYQKGFEYDELYAICQALTL